KDGFRSSFLSSMSVVVGGGDTIGIGPDIWRLRIPGLFTLSLPCGVLGLSKPGVVGVFFRPSAYTLAAILNLDATLSFVIDEAGEGVCICDEVVAGDVGDVTVFMGSSFTFSKVRGSDFCSCLTASFEVFEDVDKTDALSLSSRGMDWPILMEPESADLVDASDILRLGDGGGSASRGPSLEGVRLRPALRGGGAILSC